MKPAAIIGAAAVAAVGVGAATFALVRGGAREAGAASREQLIARTVDGINAGDRDALLALLVGPASDRLAADCDAEGVKASEAHEAARVQRAQDGIDETQRRVLVVDHLGNDRSTVQAAQGDAIDPHCTARTAIVRHETTVALHDAKDAKFVAKLVAMEIAGRWFLAQVPIAKPARPAPVLYPPDGPFKPGELSPVCEAWWTTVLELRGCDAAHHLDSTYRTISLGVDEARQHGDRIGPRDDECERDRADLLARFAACSDQ